ncbi:MAG: hypothetical protein B9S34_02470 [Opitutia bacterium Tous-C1TDCM]|nr:MAG: hypothetical protein B9S34_02470 [Opitutae bacterium Tous-C1TDCM]
MKKFLARLLALAALVAAPAAHAITLNGEIRNIDGDNDGFADDLLIQRISFDVTAGTSLFFDSLVWEATGVDLNGDGELTGFDNYMMLLTAGGSYLTANDDSGATYGDGSVHPYDSTIGYTFGTAGTYVITLGQLAYSTSEAMQGYQANRNYYDYNGNNLDHGDWRLTISVNSGSISNLSYSNSNSVPDTATVGAMLGAAILGLAAFKRRR